MTPRAVGPSAPFLASRPDSLLAARLGVEATKWARGKREYPHWWAKHAGTTVSTKFAKGSPKLTGMGVAPWGLGFLIRF